jgi:hypothetical protein
MQLVTGLNGSVFTSGYPAAAVPAAAGTTPQGPSTIGQQAFGITAGVPGGATSYYALVGGGTLALAALIFLWWSLPR